MEDKGTANKIRPFFSGPATKALPSPPLELSGLYKNGIFFAASLSKVQNKVLDPVQVDPVLEKFVSGLNTRNRNMSNVMYKV